METADRRRVAAVSGGSSGIGRAIAEAFGGRGWAVAVGARREDRVKEAVAAVSAAGGSGLGAFLDVSDADSVESFYAAAEDALGPVDLVVSCAAHARPGALHELSPDEIRSQIETDLIGALFFVREGLRRMIERGARGDVVFISSIGAEAPWPFLTPYAASKAGVEQASRSLAQELEGTGIRSLVVRPGNTGGTSWVEGWEPAELANVAEWQRRGLLRHENLLTPQQVAQAVVTAVTAPPGVAVDHISVSPQAPTRRKSV